MSNTNINTPVPTGGMAPLSATREQSIADSVTSTADLQKSHPHIDWKGAVIEPTVNMAFDLKVLPTFPCNPLPVSMP